ncbi:unnamed protein product [Blepharisma stoltei]|uniref:Uncharacterized protein n=1 Tax=Blepharisma stoltei TaxID=1481888 RepID=A0AAU9J9R2_9CILI|nr:unnamed protein product [Blepharisma stoltei]
MSRKINSKHNHSKHKNISAFPKLPKHFAEQVIDLESDLDTNCTALGASKLVELYSAAVEYYGSIKDTRYLHYKERIQQLLARDDVINVLNHNQPTKLERSRSEDQLPSNEFELEELKIPKSDQINLHFTSPLAIKKDAEDIINQHLNTSTSTSEKICENLRSQEGKHLERRLKQRRANSPQILHKSNLAPVEAVMKITAEQKLERYQDEIEKVMEKYIEEKITRIQGIKSKYKEQINELAAGMNNETMELLRNQMEQDMESEINLVTEQLDIERKKEISQIKKKFK